ncbi:MAG: 1,4-dihydroxy-6-naphthoate synthase [Nitrospiraceae bacterium]|nr:1,4-dihydroxy-6-naphthoate synthase [Nitrospiraceae bacterium]
MINIEEKDRKFSLGLSSCPNDTFIFYAMLHGKVPISHRPLPFMADVEELNQRVLARSIDVSKVSYHILGHVLDDYVLLNAGSALGRGCGPLLLAKTPLELQELKGCRIATPGKYTTAALLLRLFAPEAKRLIPMNFARITQAIVSGEVDAGIIIHETRFTYQDLGLICIQDLGTWWEEETGFPIPLGGIVARRSLGTGLLHEIEKAIRDSIHSATDHPDTAMGFVKRHAHEISCEVMKKHIDLYVNRYTRDLGTEGIRAVEFLLDMGQKKGIFPLGPRDLPIVLSPEVTKIQDGG